MLFGKKKTQIITDEARVEEVLTRGVAEILPTKKDLKKLLMGGKRIRLYQGFDPTGTDLHIGHMVGFRKLAQFQKLGHQVIFLVGDGTGQAGDPSGKLQARETFFSPEELRDNARDYLKQASTIVDFKGTNPIDVRFNGDWLNKLTLTDILKIAEEFTLQQLSERDMFQERMKQGEPISMREFLYPLLQGYDSVAMDVDLEIGGTDQTFNMLAGRTLQKRMNNKEKFVLTTPLLTDAKGTKIGKTEGNVIGLTDEPNDLYGKIMSLGDDVIVNGFEYLTDVSLDEIQKIKESITKENPKQYKERLALEIVSQLHGEQQAKNAQENFTKTFSEGNIPEEIKKVIVNREVDVAKTMQNAGIVKSRSEYRRLKEAGAVTNMDTGEKFIQDVFKETVTLKIGKHRFIKIVVT